MIYLPIEDFSTYQYYAVIDKDTIRAYKEVPEINKTIEYTDYYINSHYLEKKGFEMFQETSIIPEQIETTNLTNVACYRNDLADICVIAFFFIGIIYYFCSSLVKCAFKGRRLY